MFGRQEGCVEKFWDGRKLLLRWLLMAHGGMKRHWATTGDLGLKRGGGPRECPSSTAEQWTSTAARWTSTAARWTSTAAGGPAAERFMDGALHGLQRLACLQINGCLGRFLDADLWEDEASVH